MRLRHIVVCGLLRSAVLFLNSSQTALVFKLLNKKCVFRFSIKLLSETYFILRRNERDMIKNVYWPSCKVTVYSCPSLMKLEFS